MVRITLSVADDLASQLRAQQRQLPEILELGLRELNAGEQSGFDGAPDVLELLATLPAPEEIMKLRPLLRLVARVSEIIEKSRAGEMTSVDAALRELVRQRAGGRCIVLLLKYSRWRSMRSIT